MAIGLIIFGVLSFIGLCVFIYEIRRAEVVDPNEPFIYGDYDPDKDPSKNDFDLNSENSNIVTHGCGEFKAENLK